MWAEIAERLADRGRVEDVQRTADRIRETAEIFTPDDLVLEMLQRLPLDHFGPGKLVLDPACGDGQFLVAAKWVKVLGFGLSEEGACREIYGIDLMPDNVRTCRLRLQGGHIALGDALHPEREIEGQTDEDREILNQIFGTRSQLELFR